MTPFTALLEATLDRSTVADLGAVAARAQARTAAAMRSIEARIAALEAEQRQALAENEQATLWSAEAAQRLADIDADSTLEIHSDPSADDTTFNSVRALQAPAQPQEDADHGT